MDHTLRSYNEPTQTLIAIHYLMDLADGMTINDIKVRKSTLVGYMDAAKHYAMPTNRAGRDITLEPKLFTDPSQWVTHPIITSIYNHTKRWQGKPNRKVSLTYLMIDWIREKGKSMHPDNMYTSLADWLDTALREGYRGIEWVQE